jgi:hypothetical protein
MVWLCFKIIDFLRQGLGVQTKLSPFTKRSYGTQMLEFIFSANQTSPDECNQLGETSYPFARAARQQVLVKKGESHFGVLSL